MKIPDKKMVETIMRLVNLFVEERYSEIAEWSKNVRMTADEMKEEIDNFAYGQKIIFPPEDFLNGVHSTRIPNTNDGRKQWSAIFELWAENEGKLDLSVELTILDSSEEYYDIEVNNIHMM